jgi:GH15 family glucan-1,4-alpha-glucosidase
LLDDEKGGFFRIQPLGKFSSEQRYLENTNILSCEFKTETGWAQLYDFMPVASQELFEKELHIIHRCLKVKQGRMDFRLECLPRPEYAREVPEIEREGNLFRIRSGSSEFSLILKLKDYQLKQGPAGSIVVEFSLQEDQSAHFDFVYGDKEPDEINFCELEETQKFWLNWLNNCIAGQCRSWGEHTALVNRSLLVLKLLTFQPTGAISASATTSLPEAIGGERNWDYRFSWIRDASFTLKALFNFGHLSEADSFIRWLYQTFQKHGSRNLQIMYSLRGESDLKEKILSHLKGYRDSRPVRIGNDAFQQEQWDIYGEVMDTALRLSDYIGKIDQKLWSFFEEICNLALKNWTHPDYGIWEVRSTRAHFVYSKVMCWVALDRGIKIARRYGFSAPLDRWEKERAPRMAMIES